MATSRVNRRYGWKRDLPDPRDRLFKVPRRVKLPTSVDLRPKFPSKPYDQGTLGSCGPNTFAGAMEFLRARQKLDVWVPSRLFIYYTVRQIEGTINSDAGIALRDGMKAIVKYGAPPESEWPYIVSKFTKRPPAACWNHALEHQALEYSRVQQSLTAIKACLAQGFPIPFGFTVFESFESDKVAKTGIVPMPKLTESPLGGHAVLLCGYNDAKSLFIVRNSWGTEWGLGGYFMMPYAYVGDPNLASDFWSVRLVE